jgi:hypothetical protein
VPRSELIENGWGLRDQLAVSHDPWSYQRFIQASRAEFSVAKHGYVISHSGWFSERSAAYLASGRPVLVQDTGFSQWLPVGSGVLAFNSPEEALAGVEEIDSRYEHHARAAREVAESYFRFETVLPRLLEQAFDSSGSRSSRTSVSGLAQAGASSPKAV